MMRLPLKTTTLSGFLFAAVLTLNPSISFSQDAPAALAPAPAPTAEKPALDPEKKASKKAEQADVQVDGQEKVVSGMSIVGNDEAPKALVIVPWKTSDLGETLDVSRLAIDGRTPVDREVFSRALDYYEIRTGSDR